MSKKLYSLYKIIERYKKEKDSRMDQVSTGCRIMLTKMLNKHIIGGKHTPERLVIKKIKHFPKEEYKTALQDWAECIKDGLVLIKQKPNERHVSLNPHRIEEIKKLTGEP